MFSFFNKKVLQDFVFFVYCLFYDFFNLAFSKLDFDRNEIKHEEKMIYRNYKSYKFSEYIISLYKNRVLNWDEFFIKVLAFFFKKNEFKDRSFRSVFRVLSNGNGFYFNFKKLQKKSYLFNFLNNTFFSGFNYIWQGLKLWVVLIVFFFMIYLFLILKVLPFNKIIFGWIGILMFCYWLISGFVFFIKKYQFGKYTSAIQRFWRRSYILFWIIEASTFSVFFYLTINASQESFYMFDQISFYKTHLYSWRFFFLKLFPIVIMIILTYFMIISLKWNVFNKYSVILLFLTLNLTYIVWLEFYQFFHILNFYGNFNWVYDLDERIWSLELEPRRTRIVNHYVMLLFILKFWHIVFIYGFWIFFVLRSLELNRIRFVLLSANFQNFIILYIFAWVFMYPWFKFFFKNFLYSPYYWFYVNNRRLFIRILFNDLKLIYYSFFEFFKFFGLNFLSKFKYNFFYWKLSLNENNFELFRKNVIKDRFLRTLSN